MKTDNKTVPTHLATRLKARDREHEHLQTLNQRLQKLASQLKTLYHMGRDLADNENWSDALDRFLMALVNFMQAEGAALLLFSQDETVLAPRSNFQIASNGLEEACRQILAGWRRHPRSAEIHSLEGYFDGTYSTCLERTSAWRVTVIPLRHRSRPRGFLLLEKDYADGFDFKSDYDFLNTLQTIFVEEIANASSISELRQLSRFNSKVLDNLRSGVVTTDLDGVVRFSNDSARKMCPRLSERGSSTHFNRLFISRQYPEQFYERLMASKKESVALEVECKAGGDDSPFPARLRVTRMHDDNLNGEVLVGIFENLTEQRKLEDEVRRHDRLRVLGQLSASMAHEIRNPLTGIATSAEMLSSKLENEPEKAKYIRAIMVEIVRLDGIIRNLLNFARPAKPNIARCSLVDVTERVHALLYEEATKKGVLLKVNKRDDDVMCHADAAQLTQVLLNIVLNAIQACDRGDRIRLRVEGAKADSAQSACSARVDVIDSGPGIPQEIRESLFEPFVTTRSQGTGLGLAISQQIIEEHHGKLRCDFLDQGTRFSIELPGADDN